MGNHLHYSLLILVGIWAFSCQVSQKIKSPELTETFPTNAAPPISSLEIPEISDGDYLIQHTGFSLVYSEPHEQAKWIAYELTREKTIRAFERTNRFMPDPMVETFTANDQDYAGYGYDRGHLAPAADMGWSANAMAESFYYSNICPQTTTFNRGVWKRLEELVRSWAIENETIYVVTGPVLTDALPTIGSNAVAVPRYFYKVILDYTEPGIKGIGFILSNDGSTASLHQFAVSIDSVESFSGLDFFPALPDAMEEQIESTLCLPCWNWQVTASSSGNPSATSVSSTQCTGLTKAGNRCKNMTKNPNSRCHLHGK